MLIPCLECDKNISSEAKCCPSCGCPNKGAELVLSDYIDEDEPGDYGFELLKIADKYFKSHKEFALRAIGKANVAFRGSGEQTQDKSTADRVVGHAYLRIGEPRMARGYLYSAMEILNRDAHRVNNYQMRLYIHCYLTQCESDLANFTEANNHLSEAENISNLKKNSGLDSLITLYSAHFHMRMGDFKLATDMFHKALEFTWVRDSHNLLLFDLVASHLQLPFNPNMIKTW